MPGSRVGGVTGTHNHPTQTPDPRNILLTFLFLKPPSKTHVMLESSLSSSLHLLLLLFLDTYLVLQPSPASSLPSALLHRHNTYLTTNLLPRQLHSVIRNSYTHTHTHLYYYCIQYKCVWVSLSHKKSYEMTSTFKCLNPYSCEFFISESKVLFFVPLTLTPPPPSRSPHQK